MAGRLEGHGIHVVRVAADTFGATDEGNEDIVRLEQDGQVTAAMFPNDVRALTFVRQTRKRARSAGCRSPRSKAKEILRAARLVLLPEDNAHVGSDLKKIKEGKNLSPILMVRGDLARGFPQWWPMATIGYAQATTRTKTPTFHSNWLTRRGNYDKPTAIPVEGGKCRSSSFR